jgi:hypothetical protein
MTSEFCEGLRASKQPYTARPSGRFHGGAASHSRPVEWKNIQVEYLSTRATLARSNHQPTLERTFLLTEPDRWTRRAFRSTGSPSPNHHRHGIHRDLPLAADSAVERRPTALRELASNGAHIPIPRAHVPASSDISNTSTDCLYWR